VFKCSTILSGEFQALFKYNPQLFRWLILNAGFGIKIDMAISVKK
jgi:hypothetical protein